MPTILVVIIVGLACLAAGFLIGKLFSEGKTSAELGELRGRLSRGDQELLQQSTQLQDRQKRIDELASAISDQKAAGADLARQVSEREKSFEEQKKLLEEARATLQETFKALAADSLRNTSASFLQLAQEKLSALMNQAKGDIGKQKDEIQTLVKPLQDNLTKYAERLGELEKARQEAYGGLKEHLVVLGRTQAELQMRTTQLASALRNPQVRGRWGELTLQRAVEIAGMTEYCDFHTQYSTEGPDGRLRPDMVIKLPGGKQIVVDAKVPCDAYLEAVNAADEKGRQSALAKYGQAVRLHSRQLGNKSYWDQFGNEHPEFVVLFLPGENFFSAALGVEHDLIEQAMNDRVVLASPTTLIALLRAVAFGWRQEKMARNATMVCEAGSDLYQRLVAFIDYLAAMGKSLSATVRSYNDAVGSLEARLLPSARKIHALGISAKKDPTEPIPIDMNVRELPADSSSENTESG